MALMLADKRITLWLMTTPPKDPAKVTIAELAAAKNISCKITKADFSLGPSGSDTVNDPLLCGGAASAFGNSQYSGQLPVARFLDNEGHAIEEDDILWDATKAKGSTLWLGLRMGPRWDAAPVAKDEVSVYEALTDDPQNPSDFNGWIKRITPLAIQNAWLDQVLAVA